MVKIDSAASSGIFAGDKVLFLNLINSITVAVGPYYEIVGGQVCFAEEVDEGD